MPADTDDFLAHFGVKGMKWGRRKDGGVGTSSRHKEPPSEDAINAASAKHKAKSSGIASLSNKELQDLVTRTNLEAQYSKLTPSKVAKGKTKVNDVLSTVNIANTAYTTLTSPAAKAGFKAAKAAFSTVK